MQNRKTITIIAAMARNRAIGLAGAMLWRLPGELRHFKKTTMGKPIVMGRKTWESIGRALPGRQNIVVTRNLEYRAEGCLVVQSLSLAIERAEGDEIMVIGFAVGTEARAYPVGLLDHHELVNDSLGGKPVTVGW